MKISARIVAGVVVLALLAGGAWWKWGGHKKEAVGEVQTAKATKGDIQILIAAAGTVTPKETVKVGAQVSGQLESLLVEPGDAVKKGQLLAQIDATIAQSRVAADRAQLKESRASLAQQQATVQLSRSALERATTLRTQDAISQADFETASANLKVAVAKQQQLQAQIERQNSSLNSDLANLNYTKIYAPMSGIVTSLSAVRGQTLNANQTAPTILTIADLSVMTVEADVSEADVIKVKPGMKAYFTTLGDSKTKWYTTVRQILPEPEVLNGVVLYKALLDVKNPDLVLRPQMTTQVFFITHEAKDVVLVPLAALHDLPDASADAGSARPMPTAAQREEWRKRREAGGGSVSPAQRAEWRKRREASGAPVPEMGAGPHRWPHTDRKDVTRKLVMVMDPKTDKPRPRPVLVGLESRTQAEIVAGLQAGDMVVTGQALPVNVKRSGSNSSRPPRRPHF